MLSHLRRRMRLFYGAVIAQGCLKDLHGVRFLDVVNVLSLSCRADGPQNDGHDRT